MTKTWPVFAIAGGLAITGAVTMPASAVEPAPTTTVNGLPVAAAYSPNFVLTTT